MKSATFGAVIRLHNRRRSGCSSGPILILFPRAGALDGVLGVVLAVALVKSWETAVQVSDRVVGFSEEEGVRLACLHWKPRIAGTVTMSWLNSRDGDGVRCETRCRALSRYFSNRRCASQGRRDRLSGIHIEQGPVLESLDLRWALWKRSWVKALSMLFLKAKRIMRERRPMNLRRDALRRCRMDLHGRKRSTGHTWTGSDHRAFYRYNRSRQCDRLAVLWPVWTYRHAHDAIRRQAVASFPCRRKRNCYPAWASLFPGSLGWIRECCNDASLVESLRQSVEHSGYPVHTR